MAAKQNVGQVPAPEWVLPATFLEAIDVAQAHRETYTAVIKSALRRRGDKQALAEQLGEKPEHLSNMLNTGEAGEAYIRTPDPQLAENMVDLLRLDREVRDDLKKHIYLAWRAERESLARLAPGPSQAAPRLLTRFMLADLITDVGSYHHTATRTADTEEARHKYRVLRWACKVVIARTDPNPTRVNNKEADFDSNPLEFVQFCLFLHDVQCVLNRADDALLHAKYATQIMQACQPADFRTRKEQFDRLAVNTVVAECLAYRNLNLPKQALLKSDEAEALIRKIDTEEARYWLPHALENRLKALITMPRFTLRDVRSLAERAEEAFAKMPVHFESRWQISLREAEARAYLQYGLQSESKHSLREAAQLLRDVVDRIDDVPQLGPVSKTRLLRTYARVSGKLGQADQWAHYMHAALATALDAGLVHQVEQAREEYGEELLPILRELGWSENVAREVSLL